MPKFIRPKNTDEFDFEGDTIVYFESNSGKCCNCGEDTNFVSLAFEAWFCGEECNRKMWRKLSDAEN